MKLLELVGVRLEVPANNPVLELKEVDQPGRSLMIYIGAPEAAAIHCAIEGIIPARPLTHDLLVNVIDDLVGSLNKVILTEIVEGIYFAELHLETNEGPSVLSCRPSDAVALAVRTGAGIYASEELLDEAAFLPEQRAKTGTVSDVPEEVLDEFRSFIDSINPDDFA